MISDFGLIRAETIIKAKLPIVAVIGALALGTAAAPVRAADPLDADPEYFAAAADFANGYYPSSIGRLQGLLKRYPRHQRLLLLLGDACEHAGRLGPAAAAYEAALANKSEPRQDAVAAEAAQRLARRFQRQQADVARLARLFDLTAEQIAAMSIVYPQQADRKTEHFDIRTNNPALADVLAARAEAIFDSVRRTVLGEPLFPHRVELTVCPDQAAFARSQPTPHWSGGGFVFIPQADGTAKRIVLLCQVDDQHRFGATLLSRELPHELAHVALKEYFGQVACPTWLEEGLACAAEADGGAALADRMAEMLATQTAMPLADWIDEARPRLDQPTRFYIHAASWTRFLRQSLTDVQMRALLGHVKDGQKPSVALARTLFLNSPAGWLAATEERWHESVLRQPQDRNQRQ